MVTSQGTQWDLKLGAVHLTFPPDAVSKPTTIVVHRWKCSACSPNLQEHEAVVSNVIQISTYTDEALEFNNDVKLALSHSAPNLQGYELVIKRLIDKDSNEWEEIDGSEDIRFFSGKRAYFLLPLAKAVQATMKKTPRTFCFRRFFQSIRKIKMRMPVL